jgi:hypothetical protein
VRAGVRRGKGAVYRRCANYESPAACNWLVTIESGSDSSRPFCIACRPNRTIPDLSVKGNDVLWGRLETAKRRVISSLVALGLPVRSRLSEDPDSGLAFDFLADTPGHHRILTGHASGVITVNIEEAENSTREQTREEMDEPYRTLVGHFRHELGHYYWDRLIAGTPLLEAFRRLFGDEQADYSEALRIRREQGPPPDWPQRFISAYASSHPWEDWAETWAHYLHMLDTLATAASFGIREKGIHLPCEPFTRKALSAPKNADAQEFLDLVNRWVRLSTAMNEMARSMGQPDFYPFALPEAAVGKLQFIHGAIQSSRHA